MRLTPQRTESEDEGDEDNKGDLEPSCKGPKFAEPEPSPVIAFTLRKCIKWYRKMLRMKYSNDTVKMFMSSLLDFLLQPLETTV